MSLGPGSASGCGAALRTMLKGPRCCWRHEPASYFAARARGAQGLGRSRVRDAHRVPRGGGRARSTTSDDAVKDVQSEFFFFWLLQIRPAADGMEGGVVMILLE